MTWREFQQQIIDAGVKDDDTIWAVDCSLGDFGEVEVFYDEVVKGWYILGIG